MNSDINREGFEAKTEQGFKVKGIIEKRDYGFCVGKIRAGFIENPAY
jgi:hypothetical protein